MSVPAEPPEQQDDLDKVFTVFDGSSPEDVSHARRLWSSLSLLPPLESRLVSADIRQRLPVSRPQQRRGSSTKAGHRPPQTPAPTPPGPGAPEPPDRLEERRRYEAMADQRKEIQALLRRQREQRVRRERLSAGFQPRDKVRKEKEFKPEEDCEEDRQMVRLLH